MQCAKHVGNLALHKVFWSWVLAKIHVVSLSWKVACLGLCVVEPFSLSRDVQDKFFTETADSRLEQINSDLVALEHWAP